MAVSQWDLCMEELIKNNLDLEILTDTGWQPFAGIVNKGVKHTIKVTTEITSVKLTPNHRVFLSSLESIPAEKLKPGDLVYTLSGIQQIKSVEENCLETVFDVVNTGPNHRFYANDILCSNCQFIIADETLINPNTLIMLEGIEPIDRMGQIRWYKKPEKGNIYCIGLDPSLGTGGDPAAIQIFEANTTEQVGEWKHNKTDIPNQIKLLAQISKHIAELTNEPTNIYYSLENNSIGEAALISLAEYGENNIPGTFICEHGKKRKGFTTSQKVKLQACAKFKTLLESKKLTVKSRALISELKTFVASGGSYQAKVGETDDLVMATLLVVRILQQLSEYDSVLESHIRDHEEIIQPLPFYALIS
jgi:hypothetical protein